MKNKFFGFILSNIFLLNIAFSQTETSTRLPQAGNLSFGINAVPILLWMGNTLNGNVNNNAIQDEKFFNNVGPLVTLRYVSDPSTFFRMTYLGGRNISEKQNLVWNNAMPNDPDNLVTDKMIRTDNFWGLGVGIEKRKSNGNLQGYFGTDLFYTRNNSKTEFQYGNGHSISNQSPTSTYDFDNRLSRSANTRTIKTSEGIDNTLALRAFVGAEYFFAKGMSLGVEYGLSFAYSRQKEGFIQTETFNAATNSIMTGVQRTGSKSQYSDGLDNQGGAISLNFYF